MVRARWVIWSSTPSSFGALLDTGVQVTDDGAGLFDRLALELEDQPEHAVGRGVLRPHVDDDVLVAADLAHHGVPVATGDGEDLALGGVARACVVSAHLSLRCPGHW